MKSRVPQALLHARPSGAGMIAGTMLLIGVASMIPLELFAQAAPAATRLEMRHFWHVFIAYALAWAILFGWVLSILKRLRRVEEKLD